MPISFPVSKIYSDRDSYMNPNSRHSFTTRPLENMQALASTAPRCFVHVLLLDIVMIETAMAVDVPSDHLG
jgi:hypothetical protein